MARALLALFLMCAHCQALAADDLKLAQLESDVRDLKRQLLDMSRQLDAMRSQIARAGDRPRPPPATAAAPTSPATWVDASRWRRLATGMSELEVIGLLGAPTSMRTEQGERTLLYAMEIGSSGFLGGSVRMHDGRVIKVQEPVLQ
jgi:outer membrane murein-binding lipoprotein Lpp